MILAVLASAVSPGSAQDHLTPDRAAYFHAAEYPKPYLLKVGHVFSQAFEDGVALRAITLHSRRIVDGEVCVGITMKEGQAEAFLLEPTSSLLLSQSLEDCRDSIDAHKEDGTAVPRHLLDRLEYLTKKKAEDFRKIKATRRSRPVPGPLADEIRSLWERMLLETKHPKTPGRGLDGITYYFSAWVRGYGEISGQVWSPKEGSKAEKLTRLAKAIGDYAGGKIELRQLQESSAQARAAILSDPAAPTPSPRPSVQ
ncbi:hypothetical protein TA3x_004519 [Tundrisphaera sp. TA3]|uniref:hypothetical protein n=1 Tax=Tundrisphaera sp. TA3 TaxID=3435775 RepID=UPI003EC118B3